MDKPVKKTKTYWDFSECVDYIQSKYECDIRDYAGQFGKPAQNSPAVVVEPLVDDRPPYWDFWHMICHRQPNLSNGSFFTITEEWKDWPKTKDWQKEIISLFIEEFGEDGEVEFYTWW